MSYIKPKPLKKGDTIAFIAPAGAIKERENIVRAEKYFQNLGYNVILSEHLFNRLNYLSDTDENRLEDIYQTFLNPDIDAIICARGGYGCLRLINKIDYNIIKNNPKLFCGYSDITVLSAMFLKRANLITYSGAMANGDFGAMKISDYTMDNFFKAVEGNENLIFKSKKTYNQGAASGILFGGNLSSLVSLCGVDFLPDEDFIFFSEDLNEPVYKLDKMFTQLMNIDKFKNHLKGIILGDFLDNGYPEQFDEFVENLSKELNIPALGGFKITHDKDKITLPYGAPARIEDGTLVINNTHF